MKAFDLRKSGSERQYQKAKQKIEREGNWRKDEVTICEGEIVHQETINKLTEDGYDLTIVRTPDGKDLYAKASWRNAGPGYVGKICFVQENDEIVVGARIALNGIRLLGGAMLKKAVEIKDQVMEDLMYEEDPYHEYEVEVEEVELEVEEEPKQEEKKPEEEKKEKSKPTKKAVAKEDGKEEEKGQKVKKTTRSGKGKKKEPKEDES